MCSVQLFGNLISTRFSVSTQAFLYRECSDCTLTTAQQLLKAPSVCATVLSEGHGEIQIRKEACLADLPQLRYHLDAVGAGQRVRRSSERRLGLC